MPLSSNVTKTIEELENRQKQLFRVFCCVAVGRSRFQLSVGNTTCDVSSPCGETSHYPRGVEWTMQFWRLPLPRLISCLSSHPRRERRSTSIGPSTKGVTKIWLCQRARSHCQFASTVDLRLRAEARFRGVSSFRDCRKRKSLKIELSKPVRLMRGALSDKFLLISMCIDDRYVKSVHLVLSMAKKLGFCFHTQFDT